MSGMLTPGFHHSAMVSSNAQRTLGFYQDSLGLKLVKRTATPDAAGSYQLYLGDSTGQPGALLTFLEWPGARRGRWGVGGI
ncbi:MAG: VOC family protein, partial [Longimicrobiales bacterium]